MNIRWKASFSASCLHAVACRAAGLRGVDDRLGQLLHEPAQQLIATIRECNLEVLPVLSSLVNFASEFDNNRQLVEVALTRVCGSPAEETVSRVSAAIGTIETKVMAARPAMVEELALRGRPVKAQWQARGPGVLRQLGSFTAEDFVPATAEVVFVTPWVGGHGQAYLKTNRVILEAVLADPHDDLPEALRLCWLLSQLQADVPRYSEAIPSGQLPRVAALATIPATLAAAQEVGWASCDVPTISRALECWCPAATVDDINAEKLHRWWQTYFDGSTSWLIAWRALETLLG